MEKPMSKLQQVFADVEQKLSENNKYDRIRMSPKYLQMLCDDEYQTRFTEYNEMRNKYPFLLISPPTKWEWKLVRAILTLLIILDESISDGYVIESSEPI